jgi:uncharacterized protein YfaS (alpha-2-macroglobulin family)
MNKFLPTFVVSKTFKDFKVYDAELSKKLPDMLKKGYERLEKLQNSDGGWGWWENDSSNPELTALVVYGLSLTGNMDYHFYGIDLDRGTDWLLSNYKKQKDPNIKTGMLHALTFAGKGRKDWADDLFKNRKKLDLYSKAKIAQILHKLKKPEQALAMLGMLEKSAVTEGIYTYWQTPPDSYGWRDNPIEITASALRAFLMIKPRHPICAKVVRYLASVRRSGSWYSTKDTAEVVLALTDYLKYTGELQGDFTGSIKVNDRDIGTFSFKNSDENCKSIDIDIPPGILKIGDNRITIEKSGTGRLYYNTSLSWYDNSENIKGHSGGISIKREYFLINPKIKPNNKGWVKPLKGPVAKISVQDKVLVRLTFQNYRDYEHVITEDPKPAGFERTELHSIGEKANIRNITDDTYFLKVEDRDNRTVLFDSYLPETFCALMYALKPETPGRFHTMPAKASLMYIPGIQGTSDEMIFEVTGEKGSQLSPIPKVRWDWKL